MDILMAIYEHPISLSFLRMQHVNENTYLYYKRDNN